MSVSHSNTLPSEHAEQRTLVKWFRRQYPDAYIFAIPNGDGRSKSAGARLKAEGVSSGVPDLYVPAWNLWIEMKRQKGGRLSDNQKNWIAYLEGVGHTVIVGYGFDDAREKIIGHADRHMVK
jgi:hypothetical protein